MLCSKCGDPIKPIVAVDIDGTLGDFHSHFLDFVEGWSGTRLELGREYAGAYVDSDGTPRLDSPFKRWVRGWLPDLSDSDWHTLKLAYRQGGFKRTMPVYEGAAGLCEAIRSAGAELWLTTTRPYLRLDNVDPDTREWLRRTGIEFDGLLYDEEKYAVLAERVESSRVVMILDDLVDQVEEASHYFGGKTPVLRKTAYNRLARERWTGLAEDSLGGAEDVALRRIREWRDEHE